MAGVWKVLSVLILMKILTCVRLLWRKCVCMYALVCACIHAYVCVHIHRYVYIDVSRDTHTYIFP